MHKSTTTDATPKRKPDVVHFYNHNKVGVDCVDTMVKKYSTKQPSRRWLVAVFCNILDVSAVNSWIIYKKVTGNAISRRDFIIKLAEEVAAVGPIFETPGPETPISSQLSDIVSPIDEVCCLPLLEKRKECATSLCRNKTFSYCKIANYPSVDLALTQTRNAQKLFMMIVLQQIVKLNTNSSFHFVRETFDNK